ncbi:hypothetical protein HMPREF1982_03518 [Clostridiales bacterium oral taxon 876 str. F0540]|nr:hypothetical protein HMPREF1982_03518 [Clostridiales bacterium oral taxon 876 str. F0540]
MEDKVKFIEACQVHIKITEDNASRVHEILRELIKLGAIKKDDGEFLLCACELL